MKQKVTEMDLPYVPGRTYGSYKKKGAIQRRMCIRTPSSHSRSSAIRRVYHLHKSPVTV